MPGYAHDNKNEIMNTIDWIEERLVKMKKRLQKHDEGSEKYLKLESRIERYETMLDEYEEMALN